MQIAIVGAGIAGLTLGAALSRVGMRCQIYEQAPKVREVGSGIQLTPNAVRLLQRLGLTEHLRTVAVPVQAIERRRWDDGRVVSHTSLGAECEELFEAPYYTAHRADLHQGLLSLIEPEKVHLGATCTTIVEHANGVTLRFADDSVAEADLLVGADGVHSNVRASLMNDAPKFAGQTIYRGILDAKQFPHLTAEPKVRVWVGPGQHCVCYPISAGRAISFAATAPAEERLAESWSALGKPANLRNTYLGWDQVLNELFAAVEEVGLWAMHDRDPVSRWSSDRTTLVGDAAHPMLPFMAQGANQAIEDAFVLAACLRESGFHDQATSLRRYESLRQERTARVQEGSRANGTTFHHADGARQRARDETASTTQSLQSRAWLYGYDAELAVNQ